MALPYSQTGAKGFNLAATQYKVTAKVVARQLRSAGGIGRDAEGGGAKPAGIRSPWPTKAYSGQQSMRQWARAFLLSQSIQTPEAARDSSSSGPIILKRGVWEATA